jgi:hypothetical protein
MEYEGFVIYSDGREYREEEGYWWVVNNRESFGPFVTEDEAEAFAKQFPAE